LDTLQDSLKKILSQADEAVSGAQDLKKLDEVRVRFLGKSGSVTELLKELAKVPPAEKPVLGKAINEVKNKVSLLLEQKKEALDSSASDAPPPGFDPTLPGRILPVGKLNPLTKVMKDITGIFKEMGFDLAEGPDAETDYYNFLALNFPPDHPARDAQDTFYLSDDLLMRTHTSPIQIRVMQNHKPPFKFIAPGRVYRNEAIDATHHHIFHQVEGFLVDEGIHFGHLKGTLDTFIKRFFGNRVQTRFRPSFFPFTEPSAEMDISCIFCEGKGCRICKQSGWVELLGCGMIDPAVLTNCGVDPERWTGFAFGMGVERIALFQYDIDDIRLFYQNDLRFLRQF
jgi:phenylalanyl-tRNA synthetase alpha chain